MWKAQLKGSRQTSCSLLLELIHCGMHLFAQRIYYTWHNISSKKYLYSSFIYIIVIQQIIIIFFCKSFWGRVHCSHPAFCDLLSCFDEQRMLAQIQQPYKVLPSPASVVLMPGAFQTLNGCQGKAGNLSYISEIRNGRHLGYTDYKALLSRLFPVYAL